mmetsp:Transcript_37414/g.73349  ORF Transcript_37414/g.73349 Transcript_37414/m.73349 type:complete len:90 (-) Transcript_37414:132-401(-)
MVSRQTTQRPHLSCLVRPVRCKNSAPEANKHDGDSAVEALDISDLSDGGEDGNTFAENYVRTMGHHMDLHLIAIWMQRRRGMGISCQVL